MREHDVTALTARDLERARRELAATMALIRPDSLARTPTLAHLTATDIELTRRTGQQPDSPLGSPTPRRPIPRVRSNVCAPFVPIGARARR
jgi:hypothetical protein